MCNKKSVKLHTGVQDTVGSCSVLFPLNKLSSIGSVHGLVYPMRYLKYYLSQCACHNFLQPKRMFCTYWFCLTRPKQKYRTCNYMKLKRQHIFTLEELDRVIRHFIGTNDLIFCRSTCRFIRLPLRSTVKQMFVHLLLVFLHMMHVIRE